VATNFNGDKIQENLLEMVIASNRPNERKFYRPTLFPLPGSVMT